MSMIGAEPGGPARNLDGPAAEPGWPLPGFREVAGQDERHRDGPHQQAEDGCQSGPPSSSHQPTGSGSRDGDEPKARGEFAERMGERPNM